MDTGQTRHSTLRYSLRLPAYLMRKYVPPCCPSFMSLELAHLCTQLPFLSLLPPFAPLRPDVSALPPPSRKELTYPHLQHRYGTPEPPPHPYRYVAPEVDPFPPYIRPRSASPSRYTIRGVVVVEPKGSKSNPIVIKDHDHPAKRRRPDDDHVGNQVVKAVPQPPRPTQPPASSSRQKVSENVPPTATPSPRKGKGRASGVPPSPVSPARSSARLAAKQPSTPRKVNSTPKAKQRVGRAAAGTAHSPVKSSPLKQVAFRAPTVEVASLSPEARSRWYIPKRKRSTDSLSISESSSSSSDSDSDSDSGSEYCD